MATSRPMDARLKEKSSSASSAPHHTDTLHGRRPTRPLVPGSSDRDPVRKPMASSSTTAVSRGRSQTPSSAAAAAGKRVPVKSPIEKPPSPSGASRRVPTTNTIKERTGKSSSSLPRAAISSKPASDKASKPLKSAKGQPLVRTRSLGATTKKATVTAIPDTIEPPPATKSEQEEETQIQVEESEPVDVPAIKDDVADDLGITDSFAPNIPEDTTDFTSQTDQQEPGSPKNESEIATNDEGLGGDGNGEDGDKEKSKEPEEEPVIESSEEPQSEPAVVSGKPEEAETEKATAMESSETKKPEVVAFKRPEAAATGRKFIKDGPRSNDVIEEARTKLMVKRKSKVLALVGAFETVISLQEPEDQTGETSQSQGKSGDEGAEEESNATKESTESTSS